jgi:Mg2+ and Co2+ transporter CorA
MTVDEVLSQQEEILNQFASGAEPSATNHRFFGRITAAQKQLAGFRKRVAKIYRDAERIDSMINGALDLKRTHASIQDARASLQDARSSLLLGWAVMGFTVITVLFAPIAFMTALFALPIDGLVKKQRAVTDAAGEPISVYSSGYVTWTFCKHIGDF